MNGWQASKDHTMTFFGFLSEQGVIGLLLYLALLAMTVVGHRNRGQTDPEKWEDCRSAGSALWPSASFPLRIFPMNAAAIWRSSSF